MGGPFTPRAFDDSLRTVLDRGWTLRRDAMLAMRMLHESRFLESTRDDRDFKRARAFLVHGGLAQIGNDDLVCVTDEGERAGMRLMYQCKRFSSEPYFGQTVTRDLVLAAVEVGHLDPRIAAEMCDLAAARRQCDRGTDVLRGLWWDDGGAPWAEPAWMDFAGQQLIPGHSLVAACQFLADHGLINGARTTVEGHRVMAEYGGSVEAYLSRTSRLQEARSLRYRTNIHTSGGAVVVGNTGQMNAGTIEQSVRE